MGSSMRVAIVAVIGLVACVGDASPTTVPDSGSPNDGSVADAGSDAAKVDAGDAAPPPPACTLAKPFGAPTTVDAVNSANNDLAARLSEDELTMYFASDRGGTSYDVWVAKRNLKTDPFSAPAVVPVVNTTFIETDPSITADGLTLYLSSRSLGGKLHVFSTTRALVTQDFGAIQLVSGISANDTIEQADSFIVPDGKTLWFSKFNGGSDFDIYSATLGSAGFGTPVPHAELNTAGHEGYIAVTPDQLLIVFGRDPTLSGKGDIYQATRTTTANGFGPPAALGELNTSFDEGASWISPDACRIYFFSNRAGTYDIYTAVRPL